MQNTEDPAQPLRVAVSMPAHNAARFVAAAMESVLEQEGVALRLFVVDDGSTDRTAEIVRRVGDPRVVVLSNRVRSGIGAAHNRVIEASDEPFIAHVDADDVIVSGSLARMVHALARRPEAGQAYCDFFPLDEAGNSEPGDIERWRDFFAVHRAPPIDYRRELIEDGMVVSALRTYRRSVLEEAGGFDESLDWAVDYEMALRMAERTTFLRVPEMLYGRRVHPDGASQRIPRRALRQWWRRRVLVERQLRAQGGRVLGRGRYAARRLLLKGLRDAIRTTVGATGSPIE